MPKRFPEPSDDVTICVLKRVIQHLQLPYQTPADHRRIQQVLSDMKRRQVLDLGYIFDRTNLEMFQSDKLSLDLDQILMFDRIGWQGLTKTGQLHAGLIARIVHYRQRILPSLLRVTPIRLHAKPL